MKKNLLTLALVAVALVGFTGCGDDEPTPPPAEQTFSFKANQKYTYESTPRDMNNQPEAANTRLVNWTVLETGLTFEGKTGVSRIKEERLAADGIAVESTDTIYIATTTNGEFYQYNLVGSVVSRIPAAALIVDSIPPVWTKLGDTKTTATASFDATPETTTPITVPIGGGIVVQVTSSIRGQYLGKGSVTVPLKTSTNAFSSDLMVKLRATASGVPLTNDSLKMNTALEATSGILLQSLESKTVGFINPSTFQPEPQAIAGYDMKLKAVVQP